MEGLTFQEKIKRALIAPNVRYVNFRDNLFLCCKLQRRKKRCLIKNMKIGCLQSGSGFRRFSRQKIGT